MGLYWVCCCVYVSSLWYFHHSFLTLVFFEPILKNFLLNQDSLTKTASLSPKVGIRSLCPPTTTTNCHLWDYFEGVYPVLGLYRTKAKMRHGMLLHGPLALTWVVLRESNRRLFEANELLLIFLDGVKCNFIDNGEYGVPICSEDWCLRWEWDVFVYSLFCCTPLVHGSSPSISKIILYLI